MWGFKVRGKKKQTKELERAKMGSGILCTMRKFFCHNLLKLSTSEKKVVDPSEIVD